jgi:hypothetical protein
LVSRVTMWLMQTGQEASGGLLPTCPLIGRTVQTLHSDRQTGHVTDNIKISRAAQLHVLSRQSALDQVTKHHATTSHSGTMLRLHLLITRSGMSL